MPREGPQIVVDTCHPGGTGQTPEAEQRDTLDVGSQSDCRCQPRVDGRHRYTSAGDHHNDVDLVGCDARRLERRQYGSLPDVDGNLDVGSVRFGEASQFRVPRQRERQTAVVDSSRSGKAHEPLVGERGQLACHVFLVVPVWWDRHRGAGNGWRADGEKSNRVCGCEIRCFDHKSENKRCPVE